MFLLNNQTNNQKPRQSTLIKQSLFFTCVTCLVSMKLLPIIHIPGKEKLGVQLSSNCQWQKKTNLLGRHGSLFVLYLSGRVCVRGLFWWGGVGDRIYVYDQYLMLVINITYKYSFSCSYIIYNPLYTIACFNYLYLMRTLCALAKVIQFLSTKRTN